MTGRNLTQMVLGMLSVLTDKEAVLACSLPLAKEEAGVSLSCCGCSVPARLASMQHLRCLLVGSWSLLPSLVCSPVTRLVPRIERLMGIEVADAAVRPAKRPGTCLLVVDVSSALYAAAELYNTCVSLCDRYSLRNTYIGVPHCLPPQVVVRAVCSA